MKYNSKEVLTQVKKILNEMANEAILSIWSGSKADEPLASDVSLLNKIDSTNLGKLLQLSNPVLLCDDDLVELSIRNETTNLPFSIVKTLRPRDFYPEFKNNQKTEKGDTLLKVALVEPSEYRLNLLDNLESIVIEACEKTSKHVEKVLKSKVSENVIYKIDCVDHESSLVFDGSNLVASGNDCDFHPGCCGLSKYKGIKLGDYNGAENLASILSAGIKKKIVNLDVNAENYDILQGNLLGVINFQSNNSSRVEPVTMENLLREDQLKVENAKDDKINVLKSKKTSLTREEMLFVLEKRYGKKIFSFGKHDDTEIIEVKYGNFYSYEQGITESFEKYVLEFKGWYVEIMDAESIAVFPS